LYIDIALEQELIVVVSRRILVVYKLDRTMVFAYDLRSDDVFGGNRTPIDPIMSNPAVQFSDDGSVIFVSLCKRSIRFRLQ